MVYDFDQVLDRRNTSSMKWDGVVHRFGRADILPLWVADMDFKAPQPVIDAIAERARHGVYGYTDIPTSYHESVVSWVRRRHGWDIQPEWMLSTPGVVPGLAVAIMAFTEPGDKVLIQSPVYPPFFSIIRENGRELVNSQLVLAGDRYVMDFEDLEAQLDLGVKLVILCSPANPVGRVWTREELSRLAQMCVSRGIVIASDEIHSDIVYSSSKHIPIASLSNEVRDNTLTFIAPSKTFNLAGLATSVAIVPDPCLRERFERVLGSIGIGVNLFGITALEAAYTHGEEWLGQVLRYLEGNLDFLCRFVDERIPGIRVIRAEGTYVIWLDCRGLGMTPRALREFMVSRARVGLNDGVPFGPGGEGFQRINIACPNSILGEALERIETASKSLQYRQ
ncbi:MAG: PatB family C-S lyase [Firmicutes bacterium]|jgi:cystathionine beta-lyase|nr:PatB family C-S lyase [Bacillota bacterium]